MSYFNEIAKQYKWNYEQTNQIPVCPECYDHDQAPIEKAYDCKNVFSGTNTQCCCTSIAHGRK